MMLITLIVVIIIIIVILNYKTILHSFNKSVNKFIIPESVKNSYRKIDVPINELKILTNDYYEDKGNDNERIGVQIFDGDRKMETIHKYISIITYEKYSFDGRTYRFKSVPIPLSSMGLMCFLEKQNTISIYFDEYNMDMHYFDLFFLEHLKSK